MRKSIPVLTASVALSLVMLLLFFGFLFRDPGHIWFTTSGDGMKAYYSAVFHVKFDPVNNMAGGMNYPFGELYTYTDAQFPVVSAISFISEHILDIREHTVAIINLLMLLSIMAGAVFLSLIITEAGVAWWYSALAGVGIAFLSPQIHRLGGHFSLAWVVWIPMMVWLVMRFDKDRRWWMTFIIGFVTWLAGLMHFYYLVFFGFITGGYWLFRFIKYSSTKTYWYRDLLHFSIQYILPVILIQLYVVVNDGVTDRPGYPFGFQSSVAHPVGVFFPSGSPWAWVPKILTVFNHISWESFSYIGTTALLGILAVSIALPVRKFLRKAPLVYTELTILKVMFWISLAALVFSFGVPFVFGLKEYAGQWGIIRQIRVLARFSWLFYYLVNIVIFVVLYRLFIQKEKPWWWKIPAIFALMLLFTEAAYHTRAIAIHLNNKVEVTNVAATGVSSAGFHPEDYQAVIPLPWFHIGSENLWVDGTDESKSKTLLFSMATGLPTTGTILSRTSLSQTFMLDAILREPLQRLEIVDYLYDERPFLVMKMKDYLPTDPELQLLKEATPINRGPETELYSLPVNVLKSIHEIRRREVIQRFDTLSLFRKGKFALSDSLGSFWEHSFDETDSRQVMRGKGSFLFRSRQWTHFSRDTLIGVTAGSRITVGFWIYQYSNDGYLRGKVKVTHRPSGGNQQGRVESTGFFKHIAGYQGDWALIELDTETQFPGEILELSVSNDVLPDEVFVLDELLIRESNLDVWQEGKGYLLFNGRKFQRR